MVRSPWGGGAAAPAPVAARPEPVGEEDVAGTGTAFIDRFAGSRAASSRARAIAAYESGRVRPGDRFGPGRDGGR